MQPSRDESEPVDFAAQNRRAWDEGAERYQASMRYPTNVAHYGPHIGTEDDYRLCGDVRGKQILELGCGGAQCAIAFARRGAGVVAVDGSAAQLAYAGGLCGQAGVAVHLVQSDINDLAWLPAAYFDLVFSAYAFSFVERLDRLFAEVHRTLKPGGLLVFSLPHPCGALFSLNDAGCLQLSRCYFDRSASAFPLAGMTLLEFYHPIADLYGALRGAGMVVDTLLEPRPSVAGLASEPWHDAYCCVPRTLIVRARKGAEA